MKYCIPFLRAGRFRALAKLILFGLVLLPAGTWFAPRLLAADRHWTGSASGLWSNPNNWSPAGIPQDGEDLIFDTSQNESMVNDLTNLRVARLILWEHDYVLSGNTLTILHLVQVPLVLNENSVVTINCRITLGADVTMVADAGDGLFIQNPNELHLRGPINLNGHDLQLNARAANKGVGGEVISSKIFVSGPISGTGNVTASPRNDSSIVFDGSEGNTFSGTLRAISFGDDSHTPRIRFNKSSGVVVNDRLEVFGRVVLDRDNQIGDQATVALGADARDLSFPDARDRSFLNFQGHSDTFAHLVFTNRNLIADAAFLDTAGGTLTLLGNIITDTRDVTPILRGRIDLPPGDHRFDIGGGLFYGLNIEATLSGNGSITKTGNAALLLQTDNTFLGSVVVGEGVAEARHDSAFGRGSALTLEGNGSITLNNARIFSKTLFVRGTRSVTANTAGSFLYGRGALSGWMGRIELNTNLVVLSDDLCVLGGPIVGPGGFEFLGAQNHIFGSGSSVSPSTYTGTVRVLCDLLSVNEERAFRGPLIVGGGFGPLCEVRWGSSTFNRGVPDVTVHPNGLVNLNGRGDTFTRLTFHGGRVATGTGFVSVARIVTNPTNVTASIEGKLALASSPTTEFTVADGAATPDLAISAIITDGINNTGIVKTGDGELRLSGANIYDGTTRIDAGLVHVQTAASLGTPGVGTTVRDGATLQVEFVGALPEPLNIRGAGRGGTLGALFLGPATGVQAGVVLAGPSTVRVDTQFGILSGVISGTGPFTKVGAGTLQFGGGSGAANTYAGDTLVQEGILVPSKGTGVTTVPGHLIIGGGFSGPSATVRHFAGSTIVGSVTVNRGGLWDLNGFSESFGVAELQGRPPLTLNGGGDVQTGTGTLMLPVGGDVVVSPGLTTMNAFSFISGRLGLEPGPHRFIVNPGLVTGDRFTAPELNVSAAISQPSAAADLVKEGLGEMRLGGSNSFTGPVTVNAGGLTVAHSLALGTAAGGTFVNNNASLALDDAIDVVDEALILDTANAAALISLGPVTNAWIGSILLQRTAGILVPDVHGALAHSGIPGFGVPAPSISGPGGLTKSGPGTLFIAGLSVGNSYTGPTTVTDGVLEAVRQGRSVSSNIVVTGSNSVLRTGRAGNQFVSAPTVLPKGASVSIENGALWAMNGANFETISRLVGDGRLQVSTGGALTISNTVSCEFSGQISGSGALNKLGLATFHVTGNSPGYTGLATVFDGTYKVDAQFLNSPVTVKNSSILRGMGVVGNVVVESGGVVRADSDGPGRLGGSFGMNSANFQNGGVLGLAFYGPHPTGGNDRLFVNNTVMLTSPSLSSGFNYPPRDGDVITLINKSAAGAVSGALSGFPEGALRFIGGVPVVMSYVGGDGNDVTLTVTNLPLRGGGAQLVSGNGGGALVPNDCSQLTLSVTNRGASALTGLRGQLRSLTEGVVVTMAESAYPNLAPNARGSNSTPFQIRTEPTFACGGGAEFELVLTSSNFPPIAIAYTMPGPSGSGLKFDGVNDLVQVAVNAFPAVSNNFTIELWANPTATRTETAETNAGVSGVNVALRQLQRFAVFPDRADLAYGATHAGAGLSIGRNGISVYEHATNFLPSRLIYSNDVSGWTHVALVYANRRPRLYVNGSLVRSSQTAVFPFIHASASLGGSSQGSFGNFKGQLDEVRIWNVALSEAQIQTNMSRSLAGTEPGLVTYFRCDEGSGSTLTDLAPASPNRNGTLTAGAAFVFPGVVPFGDIDCRGGGACESCFVVSGQFDTNALETVRRLTATGLPSVCDPPKPCPGFDEFPDAPVRHVLHHFTNNTPNELCVTAQLRYDCPGTPPGSVGVAAYLGEFRINQPCSSFLGDDGASGPPAPPFSFRVPPQTNFILVVTARTTNLLCDAYALELFGLPCPPPTLHIVRDNVPDKVLLQWSSAYPGFRLESTTSLNGPDLQPFTTIGMPPVLSGGKFAVTNAMVAPRQFYRLEK